MKNYHNFLKRHLPNTKHNDLLFIINDKEKQGILTFNKLETAKVFTFCLERLLKQ